jgi:hypothetical protein
VHPAVRKAARAIAEAWWRKQHRVAAGFLPEANSSADYADRFWQAWAEEAAAALDAAALHSAGPLPRRRTAVGRTRPG